MPETLTAQQYERPLAQDLLTVYAANGESADNTNMLDAILTYDLFQKEARMPYLTMLQDIVEKHGTASLQAYFQVEAMLGLEAYTRAIQNFNRSFNSTSIEAQQLLTQGQLDGIQIAEGSNYFPKKDAITLNDIQEQRELLAKVHRINPELAETMVNNKIVGFHGTTSAALPPILEQGLVPAERQSQPGLSGEHTGSVYGYMREGVSCLWWTKFMKAQQYLYGLSPLSEDNVSQALSKIQQQLESMRAEHGDDMPETPAAISDRITYYTDLLEMIHQVKFTDLQTRNFSVGILIPADVLGADSEHKYDERKLFLPSGNGLDTEFLVKEDIPITDGIILLVPNDEVQAVQELVRDKGAKVFPIEDFEAAFKKK